MLKLQLKILRFKTVLHYLRSKAVFQYNFVLSLSHQLRNQSAINIPMKLDCFSSHNSILHCWTDEIRITGWWRLLLLYRQQEASSLVLIKSKNSTCCQIIWVNKQCNLIFIWSFRCDGPKTPNQHSSQLLLQTILLKAKINCKFLLFLGFSLWEWDMLQISIFLKATHKDWYFIESVCCGLITVIIFCMFQNIKPQRRMLLLLCHPQNIFSTSQCYILIHFSNSLIYNSHSFMNKDLTIKCIWYCACPRQK